jgi:hypothetical protein
MNEAAKRDDDKKDGKNDKKEFVYFVGQDKYTYEFSAITGAQIKARIPSFDPSYSLMLEGAGHDPDTLFKDDDSISLDTEKGPRRFYIVPPAQFGLL